MSDMNNVNDLSYLMTSLGQEPLITDDPTVNLGLVDSNPPVYDGPSAPTLSNPNSPALSLIERKTKGSKRSRADSSSSCDSVSTVLSNFNNGFDCKTISEAVKDAILDSGLSKDISNVLIAVDQGIATLNDTLVLSKCPRIPDFRPIINERIQESIANLDLTKVIEGAITGSFNNSVPTITQSIKESVARMTLHVPPLDSTAIVNMIDKKLVLIRNQEDQKFEDMIKNLNANYVAVTNELADIRMTIKSAMNNMSDAIKASQLRSATQPIEINNSRKRVLTNVKVTASTEETIFIHETVKIWLGLKDKIALLVKYVTSWLNRHHPSRKFLISDAEKSFLLFLQGKVSINFLDNIVNPKMEVELGLNETFIN